MSGSELDRGRAAYEGRRWASCAEALRAADEAAERTGDALTGPDLKRLAISLSLVGDDAGCEEVMDRAHQRALEEEEWAFAAQVAFWHGFLLFGRGEHGRAGGWLARARELVQERGLDGVEAALPDVVAARALLTAGRADDAMALARSAAQVGRDLGEPNLEVLGRLTVGQVLLQQGRTADALACLDEVMLTVSRAALDPPVAGLAYCAVIGTCMNLLDLPRAREWTQVLSVWCESQEGLVPFRGQCLVHRSQLKTMEGDWEAALEEARRATDRATATNAGNAWYQLGELHRMRGAYAEAEDAYRRANSAGRQPEPGLALMRLAQGRTDAAVTTFRRLHAEPDRLDRLEVLAGYVEAMLAAGDLDAAEAAAEELDAGPESAPLVRRGRALEARGLVRLARGDPAGALPCLRPAAEVWQSLTMPYDAARVRVRIGDACRALGDPEAAALEQDAARAVFARLGAAPDLARLGGPAGAGPLTAREVEVLRLVAAGRSNRQVATELVLSEKTVARHLSNIYAKLDIGSRAAATAYAYDHHLV